MENTETIGQWWLPSDPEHKVYGTLSFSNQDGILLRLIDKLDKPFLSLGRDTDSIILGVTDKGRLITLSGYALQSRSIGQFESEEYSAEVAYIDAHFTGSDEMRFGGASIEYSHLFAWTEQSGFQEQHGQNKYELAYECPKPIEVTSSIGTISVRHSLFRSYESQESTLRESARIEIESQEALSFEEWRSKVIHPFQNLLSLATSKPNSIVDVSLYSYQTNSHSESESPEWPVQVLFRTRYNETQSSKHLFRSDMLFTLQDIAGDFGSVMERWLKVSDELDSVCNLYFSIIYSPELYLEHWFLNVVQAVGLLEAGKAMDGFDVIRI